MRNDTLDPAASTCKLDALCILTFKFHLPRENPTRHSPIHGMIAVVYALLKRWPQLRCGGRASSELFVLACTLVFSVPTSAASTCAPPAIVDSFPAHGNGDAIALKWEAPPGLHRFRVWAQWRVPEGEVLRTHEVVVDTREAQLLPSPSRWRPLKLSIEIQSLCESGAVSTIALLHQLQFDARAEAACPPVEDMRLDRALARLAWNGAPYDRFALSFHRVDDGKELAQQEVVGTSTNWPALVPKPIVIRASRACGEVQRSRATFLLVR